MKKVSFVIPTLNSAATIGECLDAILAQDFPRDEYEIVVADAGSVDSTPDIAREKGVDRIVPNPLKTGEAGKAAGIAAASGELIALVDSDNILPDAGWLKRMLAPFEERDIFASEPIAYSARPGDGSLNCYFAALGMNDPLCLFAGNYDRECAVTGKWTGLAVRAEERPGYLKLDLDPGRMPTIGANGFVFRREILERVQWQPYFFDIDVAAEAVAAGAGKIAKVRTSIIHLYCARMRDFARKQRRRICDYLFFSASKGRTYPWKTSRTAAVVKFVLASCTILPLVWQVFAIRRRAKAPWPVALWHIPVCLVTLFVYSTGALSRLFRRPAPVDRSRWQSGN